MNEDTNQVPRPINARLETLEDKPFFKTAFKERRCLIPTSGFYEWDQHIHPKQPYYFHLPQHQLFAFAGLWEERHELLSFTLITLKANSSVSSFHHRMPLVLQTSHYENWLYHAQLPEVMPSLSFHSVHHLVNNPDNNTPNLIEPSI